jgi:hypothetical protein
MKNPAIRILTVLTGTMLLCQIVYMVMMNGLNRYESARHVRLQEIFNDTTHYKMVFLGSSRTYNTIHPAIMDSMLHTSSYNAGVEGGMITDFEMTYKAYLVNHLPPEYLILTLDLWSLETPKDLFNYIQYFPYSSNEVISHYLTEKGYPTLVYGTLPFLTLAHMDDYTRFNAIKGYQGKTEFTAGMIQYKGYRSNGNTPFTATKRPEKLKVDVSSMHALEAIILQCKLDQTKLLITYAPEYNNGVKEGYHDPEKFFDAVQKICSDYNVPFLLHDTLPMSNDQSLFANFGHVNARGAILYSEILANSIAETFKTRDNDDAPQLLLNTKH